MPVSEQSDYQLILNLDEFTVFINERFFDRY